MPGSFVRGMVALANPADTTEEECNERSASMSGPATLQKPTESAAPYPSPPNSPRLTESTPANVTSRASTVSRGCPNPTPTPRPALSKPPAPTQSANDTESERADTALKTRLGLDSDICGAERTNGWPCGWYSRAPTRLHGQAHAGVSGAGRETG